MLFKCNLNTVKKSVCFLCLQFIEPEKEINLTLINSSPFLSTEVISLGKQTITQRTYLQ
jgi:hypothetical protein